MTMKNLKNLTTSQCIDIARIVNPFVDWKIIIPEHKWDGIDLRGGDFIFQIDLREDTDQQPFRYYCMANNNVVEKPLSQDTLLKIFKYLHDNVATNSQRELVRITCHQKDSPATFSFITPYYMGQDNKEIEGDPIYVNDLPSHMVAHFEILSKSYEQLFNFVANLKK